MKQYLDLVRKIAYHGETREDRTGTGTKSIFGHTMTFDLQSGFPLLTTKKTSIHNIIIELLWFLRGDTNIKYLQDNNVNIWNQWADEDGNLGNIYGKQWRHCTSTEEETMLPSNSFDAPPIFLPHKTIDQVGNLVHDLINNPFSRRHIVSAWNVAELDTMALHPCHIMFQCYVRKNDGGNNYLDLHLYQRSADVFLGVPYNIASYAILIHILSNLTNLLPGKLIHTLGDAHLYLNHQEQVLTLLEREPLPLPMFSIKDPVDKKFVRTLDNFEIDDFILLYYKSHPFIKAPISV